MRDPNNDYRKGFADGWASAMHQKMHVSAPVTPIPAPCRKCGLRFDRPMGWVCPDPLCPGTPRPTCLTGGVA